MTLGVKWSQVQILSARRPKHALTCVGAGLVLLGFLADVWQWASSVPSGREWADTKVWCLTTLVARIASYCPRQCGGGGS
jgi:hypothetical protein